MEIFAIDPAVPEITESTPLYRYISCENMKYFFEGKFSLTRIASWTDRMETADFAFLQHMPKFSAQYSSNGIFASCWTLDSIPEGSLEHGHSTTLANDELKQDGSASMWEDYCKTGGVRVATTLGKLSRLFESALLTDTKIYCGKVKYLESL